MLTQGTEAAATALNLSVASDKAPLKVNAAAGTATNLSADELDGKDSSEFLGKTEKAADAAHADSADHAASPESATSAVSAGEADTLDGKDSSQFASADLFGSAVSTRVGDNAVLECTLSAVSLFAGGVMPKNWKLADGQLLPMSQNQALFHLLETTYGGNGTT